MIKKRNGKGKRKHAPLAFPYMFPYISCGAFFMTFCNVPVHFPTLPLHVPVHAPTTFPTFPFHFPCIFLHISHMFPRWLNGSSTLRSGISTTSARPAAARMEAESSSPSESVRPSCQAHLVTSLETVPWKESNGKDMAKKGWSTFKMGIQISLKTSKKGWTFNFSTWKRKGRWETDAPFPYNRKYRSWLHFRLVYK